MNVHGAETLSEAGRPVTRYCGSDDHEFVGVFRNLRASEAGASINVRVRISREMNAMLARVGREDSIWKYDSSSRFF